MSSRELSNTFDSEYTKYPQTFETAIATVFKDTSMVAQQAASICLHTLSEHCAPITLKDTTQPISFILRGAVAKGILLPPTRGIEITRYFRGLRVDQDINVPQLSPTIKHILYDLGEPMDIDIRFDLSQSSTPEHVTQTLELFAQDHTSDTFAFSLETHQLPGTSPRYQWLVQLHDLLADSRLTLDLGELPNDPSSVGRDNRLGYGASIKSILSIIGLRPSQGNLKLIFPQKTLEGKYRRDFLIAGLRATPDKLLKILVSHEIHGQKEGFCKSLYEQWEMVTSWIYNGRVTYTKNQAAQVSKLSLLLASLNPSSFIRELNPYDGMLQQLKLTQTMLPLGYENLLYHNSIASTDLEGPLTTLYHYFHTHDALPKTTTPEQFLNLFQIQEQFIKD